MFKDSDLPQNYEVFGPTGFCGSSGRRVLGQVCCVSEFAGSVLWSCRCFGPKDRFSALILSLGRFGVVERFKGLALDADLTLQIRATKVQQARG